MVFRQRFRRAYQTHRLLLHTYQMSQTLLSNRMICIPRTLLLNSLSRSSKTARGHLSHQPTCSGPRFQITVCLFKLINRMDLWIFQRCWIILTMTGISSLGMDSKWPIILKILFLVLLPTTTSTAIGHKHDIGKKSDCRSKLSHNYFHPYESVQEMLPANACDSHRPLRSQNGKPSNYSTEIVEGILRY